MAKKATHVGECQVCGSVQKLPGGTLALHGYRVAHRGHGGFFVGNCLGSYYPPMEVSKERAEWARNTYQESVKNLDNQIIRLEAPVKDPLEPCSLETREGLRVGLPFYEENPENRLAKFGIEKSSTRYVVTTRWSGEGFPKSVIEVAELLNKREAHKLREKKAAFLHAIKFLEERLEKWAPKPLRPGE